MSPDVWMSLCSKSLVVFNAPIEPSVESILLINMSIVLITHSSGLIDWPISPFAAVTNGPNSTKPDTAQSDRIRQI